MIGPYRTWLCAVVQREISPSACADGIGWATGQIGTLGPAHRR